MEHYTLNVSETMIKLQLKVSVLWSPLANTVLLALFQGEDVERASQAFNSLRINSRQRLVPFADTMVCLADSEAGSCENNSKLVPDLAFYEPFQSNSQQKNCVSSIGFYFLSGTELSRLVQYQTIKSVLAIYPTPKLTAIGGNYLPQCCSFTDIQPIIVESDFQFPNIITISI